MWPLIPSATLPAWSQQLASILPLSALIDFIDVPMKLHLFQLTGGDAFWNWTVTPAGARLLFSDSDRLSSCCLDESGSTSTLHCIDGRYGDHYPSSHPATVRLCLLAKQRHSEVTNKALKSTDEPNRLQKLEMVLVRRTHDPSLNHTSCHQEVARFIRSIRFRGMAIFGWTCWIFVTAVSFMTAWWFAAAFLVVVPITGFVISCLHGGHPRRLLDDRPSDYQRLVVATGSLNGTKWMGFHGESRIVNSLLNKPLHRDSNGLSRVVERILWLCLRILIATQWALAIGSCSLQDWNAYVIVMWIAFCILSSTYVYSPAHSIHDWLQHSAGIAMHRIETTFSSRRAMLSALVYLSPDRLEAGGTKWIDPILAPCDDRSAWEEALMMYIRTGECPGKAREQYWWRFIEEGVACGQEIERKMHHLGPSEIGALVKNV